MALRKLWGFDVSQTHVLFSQAYSREGTTYTLCPLVRQPQSCEEVLLTQADVRVPLPQHSVHLR